MIKFNCNFIKIKMTKTSHSGHILDFAKIYSIFSLFFNLQSFKYLSSNSNSKRSIIYQIETLFYIYQI